MPTQRYVPENVVDAAKRRISLVFDIFPSIVVSVSGGKDSTVLAYLVAKEAARRERKFGMFFLDEEVVYQSTVEQVEYLMGLAPQWTNRLWLQVEFNLTNATSQTETQLKCWEAGKHELWMRPKGKGNIVAPMWGKNPTIRDKRKGFGFYDVIENFESCFEDTAFLVGLRATEAPNRYRAVVKNPIQVGGQRIYYATSKPKGCAAVYPIYDWNFHDVWKFIYDEKLKYSKIYDMQFKKGMGIAEIRCSSLIHERSFKSICELPEFEPKTYIKLTKRLKGIALAQETGKDSKLFACRKLPQAYKSWRDYRDFLLKTHPDAKMLKVFHKRFGAQLDNEYVARQQCRQLILNDYENNVPVDNAVDPKDALIEYYRSVL
jgi:predicted phosphoadenosine phosphosulfate sulfurtransferase